MSSEKTENKYKKKLEKMNHLISKEKNFELAVALMNVHYGKITEKQFINRVLFIFRGIIDQTQRLIKEERDVSVDEYEEFKKYLT